MDPTTSAGYSEPEYQHFIPQFMLRNFSHQYVGSKKQKGKKKGNRMYTGEPVVHSVNLKVDPVAIEETKVSRILGQLNMYQDTSQAPAQQRQIETMFSKIESYTSTIFRKISKAFKAGNQGVWVTRDERNTLRKFLFLLKYRGLGFHRRFYHETQDGYEANDKKLLNAYMLEKGFQRPIDVWFHNIKIIIGLEMDPEGQWMKTLPEQMYSHDAMWFINHTQMMYMAICTPSEPRDEFILTGNSYNVFEGPNTFTTDPETGKVEETGWSNLHEFAPLSPRLMIVLRSYILPVPEEDGSQRIKEQREKFRVAAVDNFYGASQESILV
ncbi:hypothetical protein F4819DRAFT_454364 [Hypoxylon fuscum]|nr:hypothetical protein F4819DRAFT_454364 [Hypoxylon fuscum]